MASNKRIKGLSPLTRTLLASGEGDQVDFKKVPDGISQDDLVAFANSETGGQILVGVIEETVNGAQIGIVRGCDVGDGSILAITNKAVTCIPPVSIAITIENMDEHPILRIEIPSSTTRPHCTGRGVYNRRDGSRNRPLHPTELLGIFLDKEAQAFAQRFEAAAARISDDVANLESSLDDSIRNMANQLGWAESQLDDTESNIRAILGLAHRIDHRSENINVRMRSLFQQDNRDDPVRKRELNKLAGEIVKAIDSREDLLQIITAGGSLELKEGRNTSEELTDEDGKAALTLASDFVRRREDRKKYSIVCKAPGKCKERELDDFCAIVAEGGEVAEGVKSRVKESFRLGFIKYENAVVGTAALKKPKETYRTKVFASAKSGEKASDYPYELGWIYLKEEHRQKGQMTKLVSELLPLAKGANIFATTRTANTIMKDMLAQLLFQPSGEEYPSSLQRSETLQLFLLGRREAKR